MARGKSKSTTEAAALGPRLQVEYRKVSALLPYANNARTHSDEQVAAIAARQSG